MYSIEFTITINIIEREYTDTRFLRMVMYQPDTDTCVVNINIDFVLLLSTTQ